MQPTPRRWGHRAHYIVGVTPVVPFQRYAVRAGTLIRRVCTVTTHAAEEDVTGFMQHPGQGRIIPHRHLFFHSEVTVHFYAEEHHLQTAWADLDEMPQLEHKPWHIDRTPAGAKCRLTSSPVSPPRHEVPQDQERTDTEDDRDSEGTVDEAGTDPDSDISHAQGATPTTPPIEGAVIDADDHDEPDVRGVQLGNEVAAVCMEHLKVVRLYVLGALCLCIGQPLGDPKLYSQAVVGRRGLVGLGAPGGAHPRL